MGIVEGSLVRYNGTGTVGVVKALKEEDDGTWALLDSTRLFYHISSLETIDRVPEKREMKSLTVEDIEAKMKAHKAMMDEAKMQDENLETGG